jgi:phage-related protein
MAGPLDEAFVEITADLDVSQVQRAARTASRTVERSLTQGVERAERSISRGIGRIGSDTGQEFGDGFASGLSDTLSSIADIKLPVPAFAALSLALASAAASAVQFASALAPAVGIVAALPSGIGVLAAGMTTLSVATAGVGEAFGVAATGTAEEFNEAMEGLAPPVQAAAQAIRDLMPELEELRNSVQGAFFQDFDDVLNSLAETLLGPVTTGMTAVATEINGIITGLAGVATSAEGVTFVTQSFEIMEGILARLQEPLIVLFSALLSVGSAINEAFGENAGAGLAGLITQFAAFLEQAAASGQAVQWVNDALAVFQAIQDILSPIVGIFASIGAAAQTTGGNILGAFGQALQVFDDFLASAQGQAALVSIFEALNQVGAAFATVLTNIAPAIPPIFSGLASILSAVSPLIGPLSQLVGSILTALAPILGIIAAAIQPLVAPLTEILELLGPILVEAITTLMPVIELLAGLLGGALGVAIQLVSTVLQALAPVITIILEALAPLIEALQPLFEVLGFIADLIGAVLAPIITALGDVLLWLVDNVILPIVVPILENLIGTLAEGLVAAIQGLMQNFELLGAGLEVVWNFIHDLIVDRATDMAAAWDNLTRLFKLGWDFLNNNVFSPIKTGINLVKNAIGSALDVVEVYWNNFISFIKGIPGKISSSLSNMFAPLASGFRSFVNEVISGWNNLSFSIPSVDVPGFGTVGGGTISTPNIPYLAQGGLVTGPTLAMIGEGNRSEAVLPLGDPRVDSLLASALSRAGVSNRGDAESGGETINATGMSGDNYFVVKIGERELTDIVVERQNDMNQQTLRRARSGTGRRF